ncbi:uncharacterized protein B0H18DRAFT_956896 [Fomitopsis serialis]|uniref:uncharacterized protein n=1 Tax=Fomitopsis serialis TaxID=139415 RepID=UPI0020078469|nr:uncharacterized protein B0H18DRAFT_956896 [Neoantrodia serialis]KAH9920760.1 hypothetical protein B0H18DRAFT_956896 [Neoantrodia serialis]
MSLSTRTTRSGREFSPWSIIPTVFPLQASLGRAIEAEDGMFRASRTVAEVDVGILGYSDQEETSDPPSPPSSPPPSHSVLLRGHHEHVELAEARMAAVSEPLSLPSQQTSVSPAPYRSSGRKAHAKAGKAKRRATKRLLAREARDEQASFAHKIRSSVAKHHPIPPSVPTTTNARLLKHSKGAWIGARHSSGGKTLTLEEVRKLNFEFVSWNGIDPQVITDQEGRIVIALAGRPVGDPTWSDAIEGLTEAAKKVAVDTGLYKRTWSHRRGTYPTVAMGVSYGGGQRSPQPLALPPGIRRAMEHFAGNNHVNRVVNFVQSCFTFYAPKMCKYYTEILQALFSQPTWWMVCCCGFWAFDHTKGGHLILWPLKKAIQFPSGSAILLPSALVEHGNVPVQEDETRFSFTQYAAGGLFRWIDSCLCNS